MPSGNVPSGRGQQNQTNRSRTVTRHGPSASVNTTAASRRSHTPAATATQRESRSTTVRRPVVTQTTSVATHRLQQALASSRRASASTRPDQQTTVASRSTPINQPPRAQATARREPSVASRSERQAATRSNSPRVLPTVATNTSHNSGDAAGTQSPHNAVATAQARVRARLIAARQAATAAEAEAVPSTTSLNNSHWQHLSQYAEGTRASSCFSTATAAVHNHYARAAGQQQRTMTQQDVRNQMGDTTQTAGSTLDATMRTGVYRASHTRAAQDPFPSHEVVGREIQANRPVMLSLAPPANRDQAGAGHAVIVTGTGRTSTPRQRPTVRIDNPASRAASEQVWPSNYREPILGRAVRSVILTQEPRALRSVGTTQRSHSVAPPPASTTAPAQRRAASNSASRANGNTSTNPGQPSRSNQNSG